MTVSDRLESFREGRRLLQLLRYDNLGAYPGVPREHAPELFLVQAGTIDVGAFAFAEGLGLLVESRSEAPSGCFAYRLTAIGKAYLAAVRKENPSRG